MVLRSSRFVSMVAVARSLAGHSKVCPPSEGYRAEAKFFHRRIYGLAVPLRYERLTARADEIAEASTRSRLNITG